jgi:hypothetical protein
MKLAGRAMDGFQQLELALGREVIDRQPAPGGIGGLRSARQRGGEVAVIELDQLHARQVVGRKLQGRLRQVDAVIVVNFGAGERAAHLAGIAAGDVDQGERLGHGRQRLVQDRPHLLVRQSIGIDQFLIGRPLLLELLERGLIGDRALGVTVTDVNVHAGCLRSSEQAIYRRLVQ